MVVLFNYGDLIFRLLRLGYCSEPNKQIQNAIERNLCQEIHLPTIALGDFKQPKLMKTEAGDSSITRWLVAICKKNPLHCRHNNGHYLGTKLWFRRDFTLLLPYFLLLYDQTSKRKGFRTLH